MTDTENREKLSCNRLKRGRIMNKNQDYSSNSGFLDWLKTENVCGTQNLLELKQKFGISSKQGLLNAFLDSKLDKIKHGIYFPTKSNLNRDFLISKEFVSIQNMVRVWMVSSNLPFKNVTEMLIYFGKKDKTTLLEKVYQFLDSRLEEINDLEYIPTYRNVFRDLGIKFDEHNIIKWFCSRSEDGRVNFQNLNELKLKAGLIKSAEVKEFLNSKKPQIKALEFLPTTGNIIQEKPDLRNNPRLNKATGEWLSQNNLPSITQLRELADQEPLKVELKKILAPRIKDIKNHVFIPTAENINNISEKFANLNYLTDYISRWLKENEIAGNLTAYLEGAGIKGESQRLKDFLDFKYPEINIGQYFPTIRNLRKDQDEIGVDINSYANLNNIRWEWFNDNIGKTMAQLIEEFDPNYEQLGVEVPSHGYPPKFKSQKFRVINAIFQTIIIKNQNELIKFNPSKKFSGLHSFFNYIKKGGQWSFVDILTGEIFTLQDKINGEIELHHINFIKTDLNPDNLVFLFKNNHNFITISKYHFTSLFNFLTRLLQENIELIKQSKIPRSWKVGWRKLALQEGIKLPSKRYKNTRDRPTIIKHTNTYKRLDSFSNSFDF